MTMVYVFEASQLQLFYLENCKQKIKQNCFYSKTKEEEKKNNKLLHVKNKVKFIWDFSTVGRHFLRTTVLNMIRNILYMYNIFFYKKISSLTNSEFWTTNTRWKCSNSNSCFDDLINKFIQIVWHIKPIFSDTSQCSSCIKKQTNK